MRQLDFLLRPESFCVHRFPADRRIDLDQLGEASWYSLTRTDDELSVVAPEALDLGPGDRETGWSCLQIRGVLDFGMVGVVAEIARILADADVSIFTVSTYNTDYFLVKRTLIDAAIGALTAAGHVVQLG